MNHNNPYKRQSSSSSSDKKQSSWTTTRRTTKSLLTSNNQAKAKNRFDCSISNTSNNEEKNEVRPCKHQEVVRGRNQRHALRGHDCEECRGLLNAVGNAPGGHVFDTS